jgi:hypothetical protein
MQKDAFVTCKQMFPFLLFFWLGVFGHTRTHHRTPTYTHQPTHTQTTHQTHEGKTARAKNEATKQKKEQSSPASVRLRAFCLNDGGWMLSGVC